MNPDFKWTMITALFLCCVTLGIFGIALASGSSPDPLKFTQSLSQIDGIDDPQSVSFVDVPSEHWAYRYIETLYLEGYILGCQLEPQHKFCPEDILTRDQAAVLIERGLHPDIPGYIPPSTTTQVFDDVPVGLEEVWSSKWINKLYEDGLTAGCKTNPPLYCPGDVTTRAQMTVFAERMLHGADFTPPIANEQIFLDLPILDANGNPYWTPNWVSQAYYDGILQACQTDLQGMNFGPNDPITRAQAACMMYHALKVEKVESPTIIQSSQNNSESIEITLSTTEPGAIIRYTLDGSTPGRDSTLYEDGATVVIDHNTTLKARAFKDGLADSDVAEFLLIGDLPNLVGESLTLSSTDPVVGEVITFTGTAGNNGGVKAGKSAAIFCIDSSVEDCYQNETGQFGAVYNLGELASGASISDITTSSWSPTTDGSHTVHLCVDVGDKVSESDETATNNCASKTFNVTDTGLRPDLTISALDWPTTAIEGEKMIFFYQVRNEGTGVANGGYPVELYVDGRLVPNEGDQVGSRTGTMLVPDGVDGHGFAWSATCGTHQVQAEVDVDNQIVESDEGNNITSPRHVISVECSGGSAKQVAVILINFEGKSEPKSIEEMNDLYFGPNHSAKTYFEEVSYGESSLEGNIFGWYTLPSTVSTCNEAMSQGIERAKGDGATFVENQLVSYVINWSGLCTSGLGRASRDPTAVPGLSINVLPSWIESIRWNVIVHELGHNHGLGHASSNSSEYGNPFDVMGSGDGHFNAVLKEIMGWLKPRVINGSGTYRLLPLEESPDALYIQEYYVEYRKNEGIISINKRIWTGGASIMVYHGSVGEAFDNSDLRINIRFENESATGADIVVLYPTPNLPELKITDAWVWPPQKFHEGDSATILLQTVVSNLSSAADAQNVTVSFTPDKGFTCDSVTGINLEPHKQGYTSNQKIANCRSQFIFPEYGIDVVIEADPENHIPEMNETNNRLNFFIPDAGVHAPTNLQIEREKFPDLPDTELIRFRWQDNSDKEKGYVIYYSEGSKPDSPSQDPFTENSFELIRPCGTTLNVWVEAYFGSLMYSDDLFGTVTFCAFPRIKSFSLKPRNENDPVYFDSEVFSGEEPLQSIELQYAPVVPQCILGPEEECPWWTLEKITPADPDHFQGTLGPYQPPRPLFFRLLARDMQSNETISDPPPIYVVANFSNPLFPLYPDLTTAGNDWPSTVEEGTGVMFTATIKNQGLADIDLNNPFAVGLYMDGQLLRSLSFTNGLTEGQSSLVTFDQWIATGCGKHTIQAEVDIQNQIDEGGKRDNNRTAPHTLEVVCPPPRPDLTVIALSWPSTASEGTITNFTYQVRNQGNATANGGYLNQLYVDGQPVTNTGDQIGSRTGSTLISGASDTNGFTWRATCGSHEVLVKTDANNQVQENQESNNETPVHTIIVDCSPDEPDLISESLVLDPENPVVNAVLQISGVVKNQGTASASTSYAIFCVDSTAEGCYNRKEGQIGTFFNVGTLALGASVPVSTYSWLPTTAGQHTVHLCADVDHFVDESDEAVSSNCTSKTFIVDDTNLRPDLTIVDLDWPTSASEGDIVVLFYRVTNEGTGTAEYGYLNQLYVNGQLVPNEGDQAGSRTGSTLVPDAAESHGFVWRATCGIHQISALTDVMDQVSESNENNNGTSTHTITVNCPEPDLAVLDISWSPSAPISGSKVSFNVTVKNEGTAPTEATSIACRIGSPTGTLIGETNLITFDPGQSRTVSCGSYIFTSAGSYKIYGLVDTEMPEENTNNNSRGEKMSVVGPKETETAVD